MREPKRGEIWPIRLSRAMGNELGAKRNEKTNAPSPQRPCLIVSHDRFNKRRDGLTIVPLTGYKDEKEEIISLWAVTIHHGVPDEVTTDFFAWRRWGRRAYDKSIIDCAQLWTIFKPPALDSDLLLDRPLGRVSEKMMIRINAVLQMLLGGGVRWSGGDLKVREGQVLELDLPGASGHPARRRHQCLVVSSSGVDAIREQIMLRNKQTPEKKPLGHCTVVPIVSPQNYKDKNPYGVAKVTIHANEKQTDPTAALAICQEVYTIDWRARNPAKEPIGHVCEDDMQGVREALRQYFNLPSTRGVRGDTTDGRRTN